jgi:hypothetical protein
MSIQSSPGEKPVTPPTQPSWGEIAPEGKLALTLAVFLPDRVVSFPIGQISRWEHRLADPETLTILAGSEQIVLEGANLSPVRDALNDAILTGIRSNAGRNTNRPGPQIRHITVRSAC